MYYPIQIPYILNDRFLKFVKYSEEPIDGLSDLVICFWEMIPLTKEKVEIANIILVDGCIDLVVDFEEKMIGFSGMKKTNFKFLIKFPNKYMGIRLMPGAFWQMTGIKSTNAMDNFILLSEVYNDFNHELFFSLEFLDAKDYLINYIIMKLTGVKPNIYTKLFNELNDNPPISATEIYTQLNLSTSQTQRNFLKHYGITPKTALSVLRFQKCLKVLISRQSKPNDVLNLVQYYDQPHFINDFKRNIGITPFELISRYQR